MTVPACADPTSPRCQLPALDDTGRGNKHTCRDCGRAWIVRHRGASPDWRQHYWWWDGWTRNITRMIQRARVTA